MKPALIVRAIADDEIIGRVEVLSFGERYVERVMRGLMRNMNIDEFYVDESEVEEARKGRKQR